MEVALNGFLPSCDNQDYQSQSGPDVESLSRPDSKSFLPSLTIIQSFTHVAVICAKVLMRWRLRSCNIGCGFSPLPALSKLSFIYTAAQKAQKGTKHFSMKIGLIQYMLFCMKQVTELHGRPKMWAPGCNELNPAAIGSHITWS